MTEYFSNFPIITTIDGKNITNITSRIDFFNQIKGNSAIFEYYQVKDNQRPEDIAQLVYNDPTLFWVILWSNNICDVWQEWVRNTDRLMEYVGQKYGTNNIFTIHHYETTSESDLGIGIVVNSGTPFSQSVTNFVYEDRLNEAKRKIKIINPVYIGQIVKEFNKAFN